MEPVKKLVTLAILCMLMAIMPHNPTRSSFSKIFEFRAGGGFASYPFSASHLWISNGKSVEIYSLDGFKRAKTIQSDGGRISVVDHRPSSRYRLLTTDDRILCYDDNDPSKAWELPSLEYEDPKIKMGQQFETIILAGKEFKLIANAKNRMLRIIDCSNANIIDEMEAIGIKLIEEHEGRGLFKKFVQAHEWGEMCRFEIRDKNPKLLWPDMDENFDTDLNDIATGYRNLYGTLPLKHFAYMNQVKEYLKSDYDRTAYFDIFQGDPGTSFFLDETNKQLIAGFYLYCEDDEIVPVEIHSIDLDAGKAVWKSDILPATLHDRSFLDFFALIPDLARRQLFFCSEYGFIALDMATGRTIWENPVIEHIDRSWFRILDGRLFTWKTAKKRKRRSQWINSLHRACRRQGHRLQHTRHVCQLRAR